MHPGSELSPIRPSTERRDRTTADTAQSGAQNGTYAGDPVNVLRITEIPHPRACCVNYQRRWRDGTSAELAERATGRLALHRRGDGHRWTLCPSDQRFRAVAIRL